MFKLQAAANATSRLKDILNRPSHRAFAQPAPTSRSSAVCSYTSTSTPIRHNAITVVSPAEQLDRSLVEQNKYQSLLRELLEAQRSRKSEQLSKEQLALFETAWRARNVESAADNDDDLVAMRERRRSRTRRQLRSAAGGNLWRGI